jgi:GT2 family glycosyltransferase
MDVSVIIVNYNTKQYLYDCLKSIYDKTSGLDYEIIVSDNGSTDGSCEMLKREFEQVILIENKENLGFGRANNRGLELAKGKYVFYLNSDTLFLNNALKYFYDFYETYPIPNELGVLGCNLYERNMEIARSNWPFPTVSQEIKYRIKINFRLFFLTICHFFNTSFQFKIRKKKRKVEKKIGEIDGFICGADLFIKNDRSILFDEKFFLYYEETDLEYRLKKNGKKIILIDGPEIIHFSGGSNASSIDFKRHFSFSTIQFHISTLLYFRNRKIDFGIGFLKFLIVLFLCNPFALKKTVKYINIILNI